MRKRKNTGKPIILWAGHLNKSWWFVQTCGQPIILISKRSNLEIYVRCPIPKDIWIYRLLLFIYEIKKTRPFHPMQKNKRCLKNMQIILNVNIKKTWVKRETNAKHKFSKKKLMTLIDKVSLILKLLFSQDEKRRRSGAKWQFLWRSHKWC